MPTVFLAKTEPSTFSIDNFKKEHITLWDGVHNYQAINIIKTWKPGDYVLIYHSVKERKIVGLSKVIEKPYHNLADSRFSWAAKLEFITKFSSEEQISLDTIKQSHLFDDFLLVKHSRLSVMPCPDTFITWIQKQIPRITFE